MNDINRLLIWMLTGNIAVFIFLNSFGLDAWEFFPIIGTLYDVFGHFILAVILELIAAKICIYFLQREKNKV